MRRFPGVGDRIRERLRALGYWTRGRPDVGRFCRERGYRRQYVYPWLGDRVPSYENLERLARDLGVSMPWLLLGEEPGAQGATDATPPPLENDGPP